MADLAKHIGLMEFVSASSIAIMACSPAHAESAGVVSVAAIDLPSVSPADSQLEEIVVTARRREENLQDTPVSITVLTATDLKNRSLNTIADIARSTPSLQFDVSAGDSGNPSASVIRIRGIGPSDYNITADPAVGIYVDGVYYARPVGSVLDLLDIARVEVLRGPQGTLFGKNTIGGAISVTTSEPSTAWGGSVQLRTGSYNRADGDIVVSGPLIADRLLVKVALATRNRDGYSLRGDGSRAGGGHDLIGRAALLYRPSDNFSLLLSADGSRKDDEASAEQLVKLDANGGLTPFYNALVGAVTGQPVTAAYITGDPYRTNQTGYNKANYRGFGLSGIATWRVGDVTIKSTTAYRKANALYGSDLDNTPIYYHENITREHQNQFSQEIQFSGASLSHRLDWVAGLYYFRERGTDLLQVRLAPGLYQAVEALPGPVIPTGLGVICPSPACLGGRGNPANVLLDVALDDDLRLTTHSYAAYAQGVYHFTSRLSATLGIRYTYETKDFYGSTLHTLSNVYETPPTARSAHFDDISPKFGIEYKPNKTILLYGSVAEGFKSGGFNGRLNSVNSVIPYAPEKAWTYEVGAKTEWFDKKLRVNLSGYYTDYTDLQLTSSGTSGFQTFVIVQNAGKARIKGFEIEADATPLPNLRLSGGLGYVDAAYTQLAPTVTAAKLGNSFDHTPAWTANASGIYTFKTARAGDIDLRLDYAYRSSFFNDTKNTASIRQPGYGLLNSRITYRPSGRFKAVELAAFVTNITDQVYSTGGLDTSEADGTAILYPGRPREWGLSLGYHF